jgi:hypothetical protein
MDTSFRRGDESTIKSLLVAAGLRIMGPSSCRSKQ